MQMTLMSQPQLGGVDGRAVRKRERGDAGLRQGITGLDPRAFEVAIRASDSGQAMDDARLKQIVEPVLSAGAPSIASAQIPFTIRDGRIRGAITLVANGVSAIISADIRLTRPISALMLASTSSGVTAGRPQIQLFAAARPICSTAPLM